jgi:hypothetical protein
MWNGHKVAYVCAMFFGTRVRQKKGTKNDYSQTYLEHIARNSTCVDKIIIGCNLEPWHKVLYDDFVPRMQEYSEKIGIPIETFHRPNTNYSYGSWNEALRAHCDDVTFAFLVEDDYVACKLGYDEELLSRYYSSPESMEKLLFCASWFKDKDPNIPHAAISNGLINVPVFRENGNEFFLTERRGKNEGPESQATFLTSFKGKGLQIRDMAAEYCIPFIDNVRKVTLYGNVDAHILLAPKELGPKAIADSLKQDQPPSLPLTSTTAGGFEVLRGGC